MDKTTQADDKEWEELLVQAARDEAKLKKRANEIGTPEFLSRQISKGLFIFVSPLLLLVFLIPVIWAGDTYLVKFNESDWVNRQDSTWQGVRVWNRFEHQYRVVGLKKSEVINILGPPGSRNTTTFVYSLGGTANLSPRVWLSFSKDKVTWYEVYYSDFSFTD